MKKLKWGILSTANIGKEQVIPAMQRAENADVVAIASRNEQTAKEAAEELNIPKTFSSYEALLEDPEIDAVYIPLPNGLHKEWVIKAAEKKKHVLCEKPAAITTAELEEMIAACEKNNVTFMEAFMYQFHPQHEKVKELMRDGEIGDVSFMNASFSFYQRDHANIRLNKDLGGGAMFDAGCYTLHAIRNILDQEPTSVYASANYHSELDVDLTMAGVLNFDKGLVTTFNTSFDAVSRDEYEVVGTKGKIVVKGAYRPDNNEDGNGNVTLTKADGSTESFSFPGDQYKLMAEAFGEAILHDKPLIYDTEKMNNQMKVLDAVYESSRKNTVVTL